MCALSPPIEKKRFFSVSYFYVFLNVACNIKKKLNEIATPFQRHYLQLCFFLSMSQKGLSKKMLKRVWQVVEPIFFCLKNHFFYWNLKFFFVETFVENFEFFIFSQILLVQVEENYTKNNDLQYFLFQMKIANAILHADEVLQRRGALRESI